jgi:serine/threonine-protein kinase
MTEREVFEVALELPAESRAQYLDGICGADVRLRQRLELLLGRYDGAGSFLEKPVLPALADLAGPAAELPDTVIGPYQLLERIGEGGFGVVFRAEQQAPLRRQVALKVLRPGMDTRQLIARFGAERQALALMDHPNIARVLDAGAGPDGRPYFVMELVQGLPITTYCDRARLPLRQRLELFLDVCRAVQHAHQKGIIHRDLKPSNVLVTVQDGRPLPKVIDFGIAKALGQRLTEDTVVTGFAQLIGSPPYMSPEQAAFRNEDIDTRSDIYSLGVLLYELLVGTTPFDKERLRQAGYDEMRRIIREEEPPRPSKRARKEEGGRRKEEPKARARFFSSFILHPSACQELDWIVMKALEKDRNRRYETAGAFAADLRHYLNDEPVQACPPSAWYRCRKFARRNKKALALAGLVLLFMASLGGGLGWVARDRAALEQQMAHDRQVRDAALDGQVAQALDETDALLEQARWPEALAVVERADKLLGSAGRADRPRRLLDLQRALTVAQGLDNISREPQRGRRAGASPQPASEKAAEEQFFWGRDQNARFARAFRDFGIDVDALEPADGAARIAGTSIHEALVRALDEWAALRRRGRGDQDASWKKLVEIARRADPDPRRGRFREALLRGDRRSLEELAEAIPLHEAPPATWWLLGIELMELGARDRSMAVLRRAQHAFPHDDKINDILGWYCLRQCNPPRYDDALRFYSIACALRPRLPRHHRALAEVYLAKGAVEEAIAEYSRLVELEPGDAENWNARGLAHLRVGHYDRAVADYSRAIRLDPRDPRPWYNRGYAYNAYLQRHQKAIADFTKAIELDPAFLAAYNQRGIGHLKLQHYDQAIADLSRVLELEPRFAGACNSRGLAHYELRQDDQALADFSKALAMDPMLAPAWVNRARAHYRLGQYNQAAADSTKAIALCPRDAQAWHDRGLAHERLGAWDKVRADWSKTLELQPQSAFYQENLARFLATCPDARLRDPDRAVGLAGKVVTGNPSNAGAWNTLGVARYRAGSWKEATAALNRSLELHGGRLESLDTFFLAMTSWRQGEKYAARRWYDRAVAWTEAHRQELEKDALHRVELQRFRAEAEETLGLRRN